MATVSAVIPLQIDYYTRAFIEAYGMPRICDHPRQKFVGDGWQCTDCGRKFK